MCNAKCEQEKHQKNNHLSCKIWPRNYDLYYWWRLLKQHKRLAKKNWWKNIANSGTRTTSPSCGGTSRRDHAVAQIRHHDQPHGMAAARMGAEGNTQRPRRPLPPRASAPGTDYRRDGGDRRRRNQRCCRAHRRLLREGAEDEIVRIFDITGRSVSNEALPTGVYIVKVGDRPARKVVVITYD